MALTSRYKVEIIGPSRSGDIWFPMKDMDIPIRSYPWKRYPFFISTILNACDVMVQKEGNDRVSTRYYIS